MNSVESTVLEGGITVQTVSGRGFTPEEIAERALNRIISVGSETHPAIRDQAVAFRENIRQVLVKSMKDAIQSDRTTLANRLTQAGHPELIKLLNE
jgi:hypothetical protein